MDSLSGNPKAMEPFGRALRAYAEGDADTEVLIRRDDGLEIPLPVGFFFREPEQFSAVERRALDACRGHVLDVGGGSGLHTRWLQTRGLVVTAIDASADAVDVMRGRGVRDARQANVWQFREGVFDTVLMLGHGVGMAGDLAGLDRFLAHARTLAAPGGQLLLNSLDVHCTDDPVHLGYQAANREAGRYPGEIRQQVVFAGKPGPVFEWLHVDPATLDAHARAGGWRCDILAREDTGDYVARLEREP